MNAIGDVIVTDRDGDVVRGVLTERDIVVRAIAVGTDPLTTPVDAVYSGATWPPPNS